MQVVSDSSVLVCALPFFLYGVSIGDVLASDVAEGARIVRRANTYTYRVNLDSERKDDPQLLRRARSLIDHLNNAGFLAEWWDWSYGAVAALSYEEAERLVQLLDVHERDDADFSWESAE